MATVPISSLPILPGAPVGDEYIQVISPDVGQPTGYRSYRKSIADFFSSSSSFSDVTATGTTGARPLGDRAVDHIHVLDFLLTGEPESIISDDATALLNRAFSFVRDQTTSVAMRLHMLNGGGRLYKILGSVNATGITGYKNWGVCDLRIDAHCTDKTALDFAASRYGIIQRVSVRGDATNTPLIGVQFHRPASAAAAGGFYIQSLDTAGHFKRAGHFNHSSEENAYHRCQFWNEKNENGVGEEAYASVMDGTGVLSGSSDFQTLESGSSPFNQNTFYTCEFRKPNPVTGPAQFVSNIVQSSWFNCYAVANGATHTVWYVSGQERDIDFDIHHEGATSTAMMRFTGPASSLTIRGFTLRDHSPQCSEHFFKIDGLVGLTFQGFNLSVTVAEGTVSHIFDDVSKYSIRSGAGGVPRIHVPNAALAANMYRALNSDVVADVVVRATVPSLRQYRDIPAHVEIEDHFAGVALDTSKWATQFGTTTGTAAPVAGGVDGRLRLTTGAAGSTMADNGAQMSGGLFWRASQGDLVMEWIGIPTAGASIVNVAWFFGFTDQNSALEMPATIGAGDVVTYNATDMVGILFDTAADTDNWWLVGNANGVAATPQNLGVAPSGASRFRWRLHVRSDGSASIQRNGTTLASITGAVTSSVALCPVVVGFSRNSTARSFDVDFVRVRQLWSV